MIQLLNTALLGLGAGAIYGLLAQGLVVVYRGSGVLNFAQGAVAMVGAFLFYEFSVNQGWSVGASIVAVVVISAALGAAIQVLVMNPMRRAASLSRVVATLGLFIVLEALVELKYGTSTRLLPSYLPTSSVRFTEGTYIGADKMWIFVVGAATTTVLWSVYRFTGFGRATHAVADAPRVAAMLGHSPNRIAAINWAVGCAFAGLAGCLIAPLTGLQTGSLANLVIPAIAASVAARLRSFPIAFAAGLAVGITEAEVSRYVTQPGWASAVPFLLIMVLLVSRGTSLPLRDHVLQRLPAVSSGAFPRRYLVPVLLALLAAVNYLPTGWSQAITFSALAAIVGLSVVVVTGYAGQISLAPYGIAAVGGLAAAQFAHHLSASLVPAMVFGAVVAIPVSMVVGLPAIRTRGINLAIVTLGFGVAISKVVLANQDYTGGVNGVPVGEANLFGWSVSSTLHFDRYASVVVVLLVGLVLVTTNLRRGASGRKMIAVRDNERAAASLGVRVAAIKLGAFAVSSFIAAIGGTLVVFQFDHASFQYGFDNLNSIALVGLVVLGGLGYASGAVFGSLLVTGGVLAQIFAGSSGIDKYLALIGGLAIIVQLLVAPDGLVPANLALGKRLLGHLAARRGRKASPIFPAALGGGHLAARRGRKASPIFPAALGGGHLAARRGRKASPIFPAALGGGHLAARRGRTVADVGSPPVPSTGRARVAPMRLEVRDLRVAFGGAIAVDGLDFHVDPGEVVGLIGPNGAGKTTAIDAITGFVRAGGTIELGGRRIDRLKAEARTRAGVGRSFQSIELFEDLSVRDNIAVACERSSIIAPARDMVAPRASALSDAALTAIADFQLADVLHRRPAELSFAQRRLIGIARSVATAPSVLLLDEPCAGLDGHEIHELAALIRSLADDWGMGIVLVEHHLEMVISTCDRLVVLERGRILSAGTPRQMLADDQVRAAYTGTGVPARRG